MAERMKSRRFMGVNLPVRNGIHWIMGLSGSLTDSAISYFSVEYMITLGYYNIMFTVRYHKQALKVLLKMPRGVADQIRTELKAISNNPSTYKGDWKPLSGAPFWRLRVGGWRAICEFRDNELILFVLKIGSRGDIYK